MKLLSHVRLFATPWTVAYQALPFMGFSRQECWSGLPFPSPGDLPNPGIKPGSPELQADFLPSEPLWKPQRHKQSLNHLTCLIIYTRYQRQKRKINLSVHIRISERSYNPKDPVITSYKIMSLNVVKSKSLDF